MMHFQQENITLRHQLRKHKSKLCKKNEIKKSATGGTSCKVDTDPDKTCRIGKCCCNVI